MAQGEFQGFWWGLITNRDSLPELLGIVMRTGDWEGLIVIILQIGFHEAGSVMRTEDEGVHEQQHLQSQASHDQLTHTPMLR